MVKFPVQSKTKMARVTSKKLFSCEYKGHHPVIFLLFFFLDYFIQHSFFFQEKMPVITSDRLASLRSQMEEHNVDVL
jgi:hypothetical protein